MPFSELHHVPHKQHTQRMMITEHLPVAMIDQYLLLLHADELLHWGILGFYAPRHGVSNLTAVLHDAEEMQEDILRLFSRFNVLIDLKRQFSLARNGNLRI